MMQTQLDAELAELATTIGKFDPAAGTRLQSLAYAAAPNTPTLGWLGLDPFKAIDIATIIAAIRDTHLTDRGLGRLEQMRNFLALLPVLLTWIGLMFAGIGYRDAVSADPALLSRPFLLLWEEGFQGHGPPFVSVLTLSNIAFVDMLIIGVMLAITWRIHNELNVKQARREHEATALERRLQHALWAAALILAEKGSQTTVADRFAQTASELLDELRAERARLGQLTDERERDVIAQREFLGGLGTATADLSHASGTIQQGLTQLNQVFISVERRVASLTQAQATLEQSLVNVGNGLVGISGAHVTMLSQFDATARLIEDATQQSTKATAGVGTAIGQLRAELLDLRRQLGDERKAYQETAHSTEQAARTLEQALQATAHGAHGLGHAASTMQALLDPLARIPERLDHAVNEQALAARNLSHSSTQMVQGVVGVNDQLQQASHSLGHSVNALRAIGPILKSQVDAQADLANRVGAAITQFPTTDVLADAWNATQHQWVDALIAAQQGQLTSRRRGWWPWRSQGVN